MIDRPAPDLRHPDWCDYPDECLADDPIVASHRSTEVRLPRLHPGDVGVVAQVWMAADEPLEDAVPTLALTFNTTLHLPNVVSYEFDGPVAVTLIDALASLRAIVAGGAV